MNSFTQLLQLTLTQQTLHQNLQQYNSQNTHLIQNFMYNSWSSNSYSHNINNNNSSQQYNINNYSTYDNQNMYQSMPNYNPNVHGQFQLFKNKSDIKQFMNQPNTINQNVHQDANYFPPQLTYTKIKNQDLPDNAQQYPSFTYYQYHMLAHIYATITPDHLQHITASPYLQTACNSLSFILSAFNLHPYPNSMASQYQKVIQQFNSAMAMFSNSASANTSSLVQDKSKMYYSVQAWMITIVSVYKCIEHNYDPLRRRNFRKFCTYMANQRLKCAVTCMKYLQNNRPEITSLEYIETFMQRAGATIFQIYDQRAKFLSADQDDYNYLPGFGLINLSKPFVNRRKVVNIWISGFLSQDMDKQAHWKALVKLMPDAQIYAIQWNSDSITNLIKFIGKACFDVLTADQIKSQLHKKYKDNPFIPAMATARTLGKYLAELLTRLFPSQFINIVGYSLGSQMIASCMEHMIRLKSEHLLNNIYILGGVTDCNQLQKIISKAQYPLSVLNCYTGKDMVLRYVLSLCLPNDKPVGLDKLQQVQGHSIENIDCSTLVGGHLAYMSCFEDVGRILEMDKQ